MSPPTQWLARAWQSVWGSLHADEERRRRKTRRMTNTGSELMLLVTEPEGEDFWLRPGETVELHADVASDTDDFAVTETEQEVSIWPSAGMGHITVWGRGRQLPCGHQRPTESPQAVPPSGYGTER
jgi:hypothetical protein